MEQNGDYKGSGGDVGPNPVKIITYFTWLNYDRRSLNRLGKYLPLRMIGCRVYGSVPSNTLHPP